MPRCLFLVVSLLGIASCYPVQFLSDTDSEAQYYIADQLLNDLEEAEVEDIRGLAQEFNSMADGENNFDLQAEIQRLLTTCTCGSGKCECDSPDARDQLASILQKFNELTTSQSLGNKIKNFFHNSNSKIKRFFGRVKHVFKPGSTKNSDIIQLLLNQE